MNEICINTLSQMKVAGEKIVAITAYDAGFTLLVEQAGVDVILVGDSLGMVVQGRDSTLPVTLENMVYHTEMVSSVARRALVVADMPFLSYGTPDQALQSAAQLMKLGGAQMVKLEGGDMLLETVAHLTRHAIPVCAHLGLLPQSVYQLGGYRVQARNPQDAEQLLNDARALQNAGAQMLVLECIPQLLAAEVTAALKIPVIGIGAGADTDGQVLVIHDVLGIAPGKAPKFTENFMRGADSIQGALSAYVAAVRFAEFPKEQHSYS